jgi:lipopolysaccharide transport system ATP-binding protein
VSETYAIRARSLGKRYKRRTPPRPYSASPQAHTPNQSKRLRSREEFFWALQNASFNIRRGESVGIIGLNGAGKSTLLKILSRITTPTTGSALVSGRLGALLEVGTGFHHELSGRENTFLYGAILGMTRREVEAKFDAIVDFAEIGQFIDVPIKRYSSGMTVRLAFAVAAHLDPDILLLDEVLAVGDFAFQRKCMAFARGLRERGATILFVSHNMFSIKAMCERVIYIKAGQIAFDGSTEEGLQRYEDEANLRSTLLASRTKGDGRRPALDIGVGALSGTAATMFDFGQRMRVDIRYCAPQEISRPEFRVKIVRSDGVHCTTFSTSQDELELGPLRGAGKLSLVSPPIKLVSDRYNICAELYDLDAIADANAISNVIGVHVRHPVFMSEAYGVWHEEAEWRIKTGETP